MTTYWLELNFSWQYILVLMKMSVRNIFSVKLFHTHEKFKYFRLCEEVEFILTRNCLANTFDADSGPVTSGLRQWAGEINYQYGHCALVSAEQASLLLACARGQDSID